VSVAFTLATWNVNSVRARFPRIHDWLKRTGPDVVCLQETKVEDHAFPHAEFETLGYRAEALGQRSYNGVAILSREPLAEVVRGFPGSPSEEARVISGTFRGVRIMNLYAPNGQSVGTDRYAAKLLWFDRLADCLGTMHAMGDPLAVCGDFNVAPEDQDTWDPDLWRGKILCSEPERARFRALLDRGFTDVLRRQHPGPGVYTFWEYRMGAFRRNWGLRIDHVLATASVLERISASRVDREERGREKPSDHAPVVVTVKTP
jgi:exodeoxyribonuclease-3